MRTALEYVAEFRGKTFVLMLETKVLPTPKSDTFIQIKLLHDLGIRTVICCPTKVNFSPVCQVFDSENLNIDAVKDCLREMNHIPVVICDGRGAAQLSISLEADKLIYLIDQQGVLDCNHKLLSQIDGLQVADLLATEVSEGVASYGVSKKILAYAGVTVGRVKRVHIVNKDDLIEELFSCTGTGTMVVEKIVTYEGCRVANHEDISRIRALLKRFGFSPVKSIGSLISSFIVFVADFEMYGCALCARTGNTMKIEYFVADKFQEMDVIDELFKCILKIAGEHGCTKIVVTENNHRQFLSHVSIFKLGFDMVVSGTETQWIKHFS